MVDGRISEATYEQLRRERLNRLEEIGARVGELEDAKRRLVGRGSGGEKLSRAAPQHHALNLERVYF